MNNHDFCRVLLQVTRADLTAEQSKRLVGAWSYLYRWSGSVDSGEYHIPKDNFYWHGGCCCAYEARVQGINAWLQQFYPETHEGKS